MRKPPGGSSIFFSLFSYFSLALIWLFFAPTQLGGRATYIMVNGNSMEPKFHFGDLVVLQSADDYGVGDVAAYKDSQLRSLVIHRIISVLPDSFVFKGDHNYWIDGYHPTSQELVGKLWIHLPKVGLFFLWARKPLNLAILAGIFGGILMVTNIYRSSHGDTSRRDTSRGSLPRETKPAPAAQGSPLETPMLVLGFLALACLVLGIFSFSRPTRKQAPAILYQQMGAFLYSAPGKSGIYDTNNVSSGEPVFLKLTCVINVGFLYNLAAAQASNVTGTGQLVARVADEQSGWERTLPLGSPTAFSGTTYRSSASLDLCQVEALVASVEQATGFHASTYTLTILAQTNVAGTLSGQPFQDSFAPQLSFRFDAVHFYLVSAPSQTDPLKQSQAGSLVNSNLIDASFPLLGLTPTVTTVRIVSATGLLLALLVLGLLALIFYGKAAQGEAAQISQKYGAWIVEVYDRGVETVTPVVEIVSMQDLAKIAERQNSMILHMLRNQIHYYLVQSNGTTYRYFTDERGKATSRETFEAKTPLGGM